MIDRTALKFNQVSIITFVCLAWLFHWPPLVGFVAAVMLVGTLWPRAALFVRIYTALIRPTGLLRARPVPDREAPHRFAQGLGGTMMLASYVALSLGYPLVGWGLAFVVVALAVVNVTLNFCAGCFMFYQLERLGIRPSKET